MLKGIVFDIKEFAVFDGPGIRTTVFFKGCPLRCSWCHNPEGLSFRPQLMVSSRGCTRCGKCAEACPCQTELVPFLPKNCVLCGKCIAVCPPGLRRVCGAEYTAEELAKKLLRSASYLESCGGGYTMSGGEPAAQGDFLLELLGRLKGSHRAVETSGFCPAELFGAVLDETELILMDLKIVNPQKHRDFTGADNAPILENLEALKKSGKPHIIRVPVIPGVNDDEENFRDTAFLLRDDPGLIRVELLPYHKTAGAKYAMLNAEYRPGFDVERPPDTGTDAFRSGNIPCVVL